MAEWNHQANELFLDALDHPAGPARTAFLDRVCAHDEKLKSEVIGLLEASERAGEFLSSPIQGFPQIDFDLPRSEQLGIVIGPYKLLQEIGEGGMGVVYIAEQTYPVRRTVALKIRRPGMDSRQVVARYEAERQALALMVIRILHTSLMRELPAVYRLKLQLKQEGEKGIGGESDLQVSPSPPLPLSPSPSTGWPIVGFRT
jgi:hypothetical protein